jgi:hypothetical protein
MPIRIETALTQGVSASFNGAGTQYLIETPSGVCYQVCIDSLNDVVFRKSTDRGITWSNGTVVFAGTAVGLSIWYDRWSNIAAGLIHCAYTESVGSDTLYRTINTESADALSTQTTIFAGASQAAGKFLSICRARGGNVYCRTMIDAGAEGGFFRLPNANVPNGAWDAARTINEANATQDQMILMPGWAADNQDMMAFFWDASANEISRQLYDDSANSWAEASISTLMTELVATTAWPNFAAAVDITNSRNLLVAWSNTDTANADLRCWHVTESAITEVTNVVLNSTDDQGLCAIAIDTVTGYWYVFYCGISSGGETWNTSMHIYYKVSKDNGTTWGAETRLTNKLMQIQSLNTTPRFASTLVVGFYNPDIISLWKVSVPITQPRASLQLGI